MASKNSRDRRRRSWYSHVQGGRVNTKKKAEEFDKEIELAEKETEKSQKQRDAERRRRSHGEVRGQSAARADLETELD